MQKIYNMPVDHLMLKVKDWPKAKAYYTTALKPLGYVPIADWGTGGGFGVPDQLGNIYVKQGKSSVARLRFQLMQCFEIASCIQPGSS